MTTIDLSKYHDLYLKTASEYIAILQQALISLQSDINQSDIRIQAQRSAHSLKSQSLIMGYTTTGMLCKVIESCLQIVTENDKKLTNQLVLELYKASEALEKSIQTIRNTHTELDLTPSIQHLEKTILHILG